MIVWLSQDADLGRAEKRPLLERSGLADRAGHIYRARRSLDSWRPYALRGSAPQSGVLTLPTVTRRKHVSTCRPFSLSGHGGHAACLGDHCGIPGDWPGDHDGRRDARVYSKIPRHGRPHDRDAYRGDFVCVLHDPGCDRCRSYKPDIVIGLRDLRPQPREGQGRLTTAATPRRSLSS